MLLTLLKVTGSMLGRLTQVHWLFRRSMRKRCIAIIWITTLALVFTVNYVLQYNVNMRLWNQGTLERPLQEANKRFLVDSPTCMIPDLDKLSADVAPFIWRVPPLACGQTDPPVVSNLTTLHVHDPRSSCCYQQLFRRRENSYWYDDTCIAIPPGGATMEGTNSSVEFVRVMCTNASDSSELYDFHAFVPEKADVEARCRDPSDPSDPAAVSVLLLGLDAVSRLNFHRQMPLTAARLRDMGAIEMLGYNKVGDNTFPNLVPVLSGLSEQELRNVCWPADRSFFDSCPWIWKNFSNAGYRTMFMEDIPYIGMFHFHKKGFRKQPTDYYTRPFMRALDEEIGHKGTETSNRCAGPRLQIQIVLDYVQKFVTTFANKMYWGFAWSTSISHDNLNAPQLADPIFSATLRHMSDQQLMNNTVLILLSDHGLRSGRIRETYQGRLEERLPFLFFVFPDWFRRRYATAVDTLRRNTQRLTSPFDLHATLADLLDLPVLDGGERVASADARGISLFSPVPVNRTCEQAGISRHWCTCQTTTTLSEHDDMARRSAQVLVDFINKLLRPFKSKCTHLWLSRLVNARLSLQPEAAREDFSEGEGAVADYVVTVETMPGGGRFEGTVQYREDEQRFFLERDAISRINLYGNQSACIDDFHMKLFCYCFDNFS